MSARPERGQLPRLHWPSPQRGISMPGWIALDAIAQRSDGRMVVRTGFPIFPSMPSLIRDFRTLSAPETIDAAPASPVRRDSRSALHLLLTSFVQVDSVWDHPGEAKVTADSRLRSHFQHLPEIAVDADPGAIPVIQLFYSSFSMRRLAAAILHPRAHPQAQAGGALEL